MAHTRDSKFASVCEPERMAEGDSMVERLAAVQPSVVEQAVLLTPTFQDAMTNEEILKMVTAHQYTDEHGYELFDAPAFYRAAYNKAIEDAANQFDGELPWTCRSDKVAYAIRTLEMK